MNLSLYSVASARVGIKLRLRFSGLMLDFGIDKLAEVSALWFWLSGYEYNINGMILVYAQIASVWPMVIFIFGGPGTKERKVHRLPGRHVWLSLHQHLQGTRLRAAGWKPRVRNENIKHGPHHSQHRDGVVHAENGQKEKRARVHHRRRAEHQSNNSSQY